MPNWERNLKSMGCEALLARSFKSFLPRWLLAGRKERGEGQGIGGGRGETNLGRRI
jgi:hypothetical protein